MAEHSDCQASYDAVASEYVRRISDELQHKPLDRALLERFAIAVRDRGPVCDLGCGPGHVARYLKERGVETIGYDLSPKMVEAAQVLNPEITFQQADMTVVSKFRRSSSANLILRSSIRADAPTFLSERCQRLEHLQIENADAPGDTHPNPPATERRNFLSPWVRAFCAVTTVDR